MESTKIPCLSNGISAGFWVDLEVAWSVASAVTCKRNWESTWGNRRDFRLLLLRSSLVQSALVCGCSPTLLSGLLLIATGGLVGSLSLLGVLSFGLLLFYLLWVKVGFQVC